MKRVIWFLLILFLLCALSGCNNEEIQNIEYIENGTLYWNGEAVSDNIVIYYDNYAKLPVLKLMQLAGFSVSWENDTTADIIWRDKKFYLDLSVPELIAQGSNSNIFTIPPGSTHGIFDVVGKEVFLDNNTFRANMKHFVDWEVNVKVNYNEAVVYVETDKISQSEAIYNRFIFEDYNEWINGLFSMPLEDFAGSNLQYKFGSMVFDALNVIEKPTRESYGYCIKDLNDDGIDELILLREDYFVLAIYTLKDGQPYLLDSFWYRHNAMVLNTGEIYTISSGGADYTIYKIQKLEKNSQTLTTVREFGTDGPDIYYIKDGDDDRKVLTEFDFSELVAFYPEWDAENIKDYSLSCGIEFKAANCVERYEIISESDNHKFVLVNFFSYCYFYNNYGKLIKTEGPVSRPAEVEVIEDRYIKYSMSAGTGASTRWTYYYDTENDLFSEDFYWVLDQNKGLVAYCQSDRVVVRDIFDKTKYYREFSDFENELSAAIEAITNVEFVNDGKSIAVTYLAGQNYTDVTEIFSLEETFELEEIEKWLDNLGGFYFGSETQYSFYMAVKDNPIDFDYRMDESSSTTPGMIMHEQKYTNIWLDELEFSCENFSKLLNAEDRKKFEQIQAEWEKNLKNYFELIGGVFSNNEYGIHPGSIFPLEYTCEYRGAVRQRVLYIKYLQYNMECNSEKNVSVEESEVEFKYKSEFKSKQKYKKSTYLFEQTEKNIFVIDIPLFEDEAVNEAVEKKIRQYFLKNCDLELNIERVDKVPAEPHKIEYRGYLIDLDYYIGYISDDFVSIFFEGMYNCKTAAHSNNILFTLNYDLKNKREVAFSEVYNINKDMYDIFTDISVKTIAEKAIGGVYPEEWGDFSDFLCSYEMFERELKSGDEVCAYFGADSLVISYTVSHSVGGHFETEIPYEMLAGMKVK